MGNLWMGLADERWMALWYLAEMLLVGVDETL